jgi:hypothetical protein
MVNERSFPGVPHVIVIVAITLMIEINPMNLFFLKTKKN